MKYFFVHKDLPKEMQARLSFFGACIPLPAFDKLPFPVCSHPDMLISEIGGKLWIHAEYFEGQALLSSLGIPFMLSHTPVSSVYPEDVRLNCFHMGEIFVSNEKYVSAEALRFAKISGLRTVSVAQGYSKCSCAVAGNAVATADRGIAKALRKAGADVGGIEPDITKGQPAARLASGVREKTVLEKTENDRFVHPYGGGIQPPPLGIGTEGEIYRDLIG